MAGALSCAIERTLLRTNQDRAIFSSCLSSPPPRHLNPWQDLTTAVDEEGQPALQAYTFLAWFVTEGVYDSDGGQSGAEPVDAFGANLKTEVWEPALDLYNQVGGGWEGRS